MTGLVVLGILLAYIAIAVGIASLVKGAWRALVIAVFVLIPTWDIIPGKVALAHYCEKEGGIRIYRSVDGVEGFLSLGGGVYEEYFKLYGYKYVEIAKPVRDPRAGHSVSTEYIRATLGDDGKVKNEKIDRPLSRYAYKEAPRIGEGRMDFGLVRNIDSILDLQTNEIMATRTEIYSRGNWLQRYVSPILGSGGYCERDRSEYKKFYVGTIRPI
jgi:hypothetical protein